MAFLELHRLHKTFDRGAVRAVSNVSLAVEQGDFVVMVGPSGCGKSTVLRLIAGLEQPDVGSIMLDGRDITDARPADRNVAMVFQDYALYPHLSVFENIAFPLRVRKLPKPQVERRVRTVAEKLRIAEVLDRKPAKLSGGQQQRVAIGRALVREPAVFLMDEPLSNLDAKLRAEMREELVRLHRETGATIVYVTHDQTEAMTMATEVVVMDAGRIQQTGSPFDVRFHPTNDFVADFFAAPPVRPTAPYRWWSAQR